MPTISTTITITTGLSSSLLPIMVIIEITHLITTDITTDITVIMVITDITATITTIITATIDPKYQKGPQLRKRTKEKQFNNDLNQPINIKNQSLINIVKRSISLN
jgi:hypothetical protein